MSWSLRTPRGLPLQIAAALLGALLLEMTSLGDAVHAWANVRSSSITASMLQALGLDAVALGDRIYSPFFELRVLDECNPLLALALVVPTAFVARSSAGARLAVATTLAGVVACANQVRLAALVLAGNLVPAMFEPLDHGLVRIQYWLVVLLAVAVSFHSRPRTVTP